MFAKIIPPDIFKGCTTITIALLLYSLTSVDLTPSGALKEGLDFIRTEVLGEKIINEEAIERKPRKRKSRRGSMIECLFVSRSRTIFLNAYF